MNLNVQVAKSGLKKTFHEWGYMDMRLEKLVWEYFI